MPTGRMTLEQLVAALDLSSVRSDKALDATMEPTLAPRIRRDSGVDLDDEPMSAGFLTPSRTLPPPDPNEYTNENLRVRGPLAEGGMGKVDLAEQVTLRRDVALKTLRDEFLEPSFAKRLLREGRILGRVEHPNVVPLYGLWTDARNAPVLVMKRIEGVPWRQLITNPAHPAFPSDAEDRLAWHVQVLMRVCDAIHYAHSKGILHLDLKPDNVMIGAFREVFVVDWGVAVSTDPKFRGWLPLADEVNEVLGTPAYLAPEMVDVSSKRLGPWTDVYLLGATLHEILVGRPPHQGATLQAMLYAAYDAPVPNLPPEVPSELAQICRRAMAPRPEERYSSVEAMREALRHFLRHRSAATLTDEANRALTELARAIETSHAAATSSGEHRIRATSDDANARVQRTFGRCRFGFTEALRQWPESEDATLGRRKALLMMAKYHLDRGEAASAETLLQEVPGGTEGDALRAEAALQRREAARLERMSIELRRDPSRRARANLLLLGASFVSVVSLVSWILAKSGLHSYQWWHSVIFDCTLATFFAIGGVWMRKRSRITGRAQSLVLTVVFTAILATVLRLLTLGLGIRDVRSASIELFFFGSGSILGGLLADRRFYWGAPGLLLGALLVFLFPAEAQLWIAAAALLGAMPIALAWYRDT